MPGDDVGLRQLSLLGVANMRSSAVTVLVPAAPGAGFEAGPFPPVDSTRSLQLWSCTFGEEEETSVRPLVDESGGELIVSIPPITPAPIPPPGPIMGAGFKLSPPPRLLLELLS